MSSTLFVPCPHCVELRAKLADVSRYIWESRDVGADTPQVKMPRVDCTYCRNNMYVLSEEGRQLGELLVLDLVQQIARLDAFATDTNPAAAAKHGIKQPIPF